MNTFINNYKLHVNIYNFSGPHHSFPMITSVACALTKLAKSPCDPYLQHEKFQARRAES